MKTRFRDRHPVISKSMLMQNKDQVGEGVINIYRTDGKGETRMLQRISIWLQRHRDTEQLIT